MFKTRLISGIVLVIIALATIISGSWILFFTLLAVSLIGMRELYKVMKVSDEHVTVLELVGYLGAVLYYIAMKADFGNYGSRDEIRRGMQKMAQDVKDGKVEPDGITEDTIESYLDTAGVPDPDLLIRTSGEQRLSNFLLWQLAYSEFYFTPVAWPDFNKEELIKAIEKYNQRDRRYGGVKEE